MAGKGHEDSIEMIADPQNDTNISPFMLNGPSINFMNSSYSKNQSEADQDRASLNALKVAFNSLQGYHNEQAKKLFSLQRKYNMLQQFVQTTHGNLDLEVFEQLYPQDQSSMSQAAGAYNESQNQDVRLQRELMRQKQELQVKAERLNVYEQKIKNLVKEKDTLIGDVDALATVLDDKKVEIANKDLELKRLNQTIEQLQRELLQRSISNVENEQLKQKVELYEQSGVFNERDNEKDELRIRIRKFQEEFQRLQTEYEEQNRNLDAKDKEITRLQSRCKQFEIENSIFRSQRNEGLDATDSGTNAELEKALELVKKQSSEIKTLKTAAEQQQTVIQQLLLKVKETGTVKTGESRGYVIAEGESGNYFGDELNRQQLNLTKPGQEKREPLHVRPEMFSNTPMISRDSRNKLFTHRPEAFSSPPVKGSIVRTGNHNVRQMVANETLSPLLTAENVLDCHNTGPKNNLYIETDIKRTRSRASDSDLAKLPDNDRNIQRNNSSSLSPPGILTRTQDQHAYVNHGAKPKHADKLGFPSRMIQSEVIYSKKPESGLTRSSMAPLSVLNQKLENRPVGVPEENSEISTIRLSENEPDYENVFQKHETEEKRTFDPRNGNRVIYENLDRHKNDTANVAPNTQSYGNFGWNKTVNSNVDSESDHIRSLKICPSCNREFSRLNMEEFQQHVYDCFDSNDEPSTLQAQVHVSQEEDRTCPMCSSAFPMSVPQEFYENHVLAHFGDVPLEFEMINK